MHTLQLSLNTRILVVDDNEAFRLMLCKSLRRFGYSVAEAKNGVEANDVFASAKCDLILTDLMMPRKDGFQTIRDFRKQHPGVKIIAMSGGSQIGTKPFLEMAELLGASIVLEKPFSTQDLLAAIRRVET